RQRIMVAGLAPIYMKATLQAILSGPNRKPVYTVTRKHDDVRWHWRHTLPQAGLLLLVPFVGIYSMLQGTLPSALLLAGTVYWGGLNIILLTGFVTRGWHGVFQMRRSAPRERLAGLAGELEPRERALATAARAARELEDRLEAERERLERREQELVVAEAAAEEVALRLARELSYAEERTQAIHARERALRATAEAAAALEQRLEQERTAVAEPPAPPVAERSVVPEPPVGDPSAPEPAEAAEPQAPRQVPAPAAPAEPPVPPPPAVTPTRLLVSGTPPLPELERIVAAAGLDQYAREELDAILYHLREHAEVDGTIPPQFDALVNDVFGALLDGR
ncbi:MAG: hypothetical protein ABR583_12620, partial [Gaiellaceae bacterium]